MTTIFVGPYRQYDYTGQISKIYLDSISRAAINRKMSVISRPLFIDNMSIIGENNDSLNRMEFIADNLELEAIVQHAPVEYLLTQKYTKNIAIPIIGNRISKSPYNQNYQKLNSFDYILVDNEYDKTLLIRSNITSPIFVFDEPFPDKDIVEHSSKKYNLGEKIGDNFIFGFIGAYKQNISIIQKIIVSFLISFRSCSDVHLLLCSKGTEQDRRDIENYYKEIKQKLKIIDYDNVIFIFNGLETESVIASLNTFDCFLSLNDDYSQYIYEKYFMRSGKNLINKHNITTIQIPTIAVDISSDINDLMISIPTTDLYQKMIDTKNQKNNTNKHQKTKKSNNKNLGETLCHILQ